MNARMMDTLKKTAADVVNYRHADKSNTRNCFWVGGDGYGLRTPAQVQELTTRMDAVYSEMVTDEQRWAVEDALNGLITSLYK